MRSALTLIAGPGPRSALRQPPIPLLRLSTQPPRLLSTSAAKAGSAQGYGESEGSPEIARPRSQQPPTTLRQTRGEHPGPDPIATGPPAQAPRSRRQRQTQDEERAEADLNSALNYGGESGGDGAAESGAPPIRTGAPTSLAEGLKGAAGKGARASGLRDVGGLGMKSSRMRGGAAAGTWVPGAEAQARRGWDRRSVMKGLLLMPIPFGIAYAMGSNESEHVERERGAGLKREEGLIGEGKVGDVYYQSEKAE